MRLKEFALDLPRAERDVRHVFALQSRCVTALYERCFPGLETDKSWKVLVECVDRVEQPALRDLLGVLTLEHAFDHSEFARAAHHKRRELALEAIYNGSLRAAESMGWPREPFERARVGVVERDFVNEWTWPKPRWNSTRSHQALLHCAHEMERFTAALVVCDRNGCEVRRADLISEPPSEFLFAPKLGELVWVSAKQCVLRDRNGEAVGGVSLDVPAGSS